MRVGKRVCWIVLALCAAFTGLALAQQVTGQNQEQGAPAGWETTIYQISHQNVHAVRQLLEGFIGDYEPSASAHFNTMTLTAPSDVHAAVRALISRYDQPARGIELQFHLLKGKRKEDGPPPSLPEGIGSIVGEVASLTAFKSFELIASPSVRTQEGRGVAISGGAELKFEIEIQNLRLQKDGRMQVHQLHIQAGARHAGAPRRAAATLQTSFEMADQETVVLGTTELQGGGDALVILVTARLID